MLTPAPDMQCVTYCMPCSHRLDHTACTACLGLCAAYTGNGTGAGGRRACAGGASRLKVHCWARAGTLFMLCMCDELQPTQARSRCVKATSMARKWGMLWERSCMKCAVLFEVLCCKFLISKVRHVWITSVYHMCGSGDG